MKELWRYPVKSMRGEQVQSLRVDARGAGGDRTYAVWRDGRRLTARETPRLLAYAATYEGADVDPEAPPAARITPDDPLPGELRRDVRGQQDLPDSLLLTTEASYRSLEQELGPVGLRRFRTNLHLDLDAPAWVDLDWEGGRVRFEGGVVLDLLHPCERCVIPTRDPDTQARWPGLLKHLHREHRTSFGINARVVQAGRIEVGERVSVSGP